VFICVYQLDFLTPGINPWLASSRKQIRHKPKSRIKARLRPQRQQRLTIRVVYFSFFNDLAVCALVAISFDYYSIILLTDYLLTSCQKRFKIKNKDLVFENLKSEILNLSQTR
jgi:hypothetical protein